MTTADIFSSENVKLTAFILSKLTEVVQVFICDAIKEISFVFHTELNKFIVVLLQSVLLQQVEYCTHLTKTNSESPY